MALRGTPQWDLETLRGLLEGRAIPATVERTRKGYRVTVARGMLALARMLVHAWGFARDTTVRAAPEGYRVAAP